MHRLLLVLSLGALAACQNAGDPGSAQAAPARKHRDMVANGATLLDVRTPEEFSAKHLDGAKNVPVDELQGRLAEIPKGQPVVVYCHSGGRSAHAAKMLKGAGYDVLDLGGMKNW
jgi:rhodanese-related sulfurtransferase